MNCHNTFPYAYRIYQGRLVGFSEGTVSAAIEPLSEALRPHVSVEPTPKDFLALNDRLDPDRDLVTLGISCESCHFGGREHALEKKEIRFIPTSKFMRITPNSRHRPITNSRTNPATILGICIQCHAGGGNLYPNGAGRENSREGLDMRAGACATEMRCVDCHEPHTAGPKAGISDNPHHIGTCIKCHQQYDDPQAELAHSRHSAESGVNCLDCHMPRYVQGLNDMVRTHRVCLPVEKSMVDAGLANACNLCHLDKSTRWTLNELKTGWGQTIKLDKTSKFYSRAGENPWESFGSTATISTCVKLAHNPTLVRRWDPGNCQISSAR